MEKIQIAYQAGFDPELGETYNLPVGEWWRNTISGEIFYHKQEGVWQKYGKRTAAELLYDPTYRSTNIMRPDITTIRNYDYTHFYNAFSADLDKVQAFTVMDEGIGFALVQLNNDKTLQICTSMSKGIVKPDIRHQWDYLSFDYEVNIMNLGADYPIEQLFDAVFINSGYTLIVLYEEQETAQLKLGVIESLSAYTFAFESLESFKSKNINTDFIDVSDMIADSSVRPRLISPNGGKNIYVIRRGTDSSYNMMRLNSYVCSSDLFNLDNLTLDERDILVAHSRFAAGGEWDDAYMSPDGKYLYTATYMPGDSCVMDVFQFGTAHDITTINTTIFETFEFSTTWSDLIEFSEAASSLYIISKSGYFSQLDVDYKLSSVLEEPSNAIVRINDLGDAEKDTLLDLKTPSKTNLVESINYVAEGQYVLYADVEVGQTSEWSEAFVDGIVGQRLPSFAGRNCTFELSIFGNGFNYGSGGDELNRASFIWRGRGYFLSCLDFWGMDNDSCDTNHYPANVSTWPSGLDSNHINILMYFDYTINRWKFLFRNYYAEPNVKMSFTVHIKIQSDNNNLINI
jgi:hypothetical protein